MGRLSGHRLPEITIHLDAGRCIVFPEAAERRAASRISITVRFVSREESTSGFAEPRTTALRYGNESSYGGEIGLALICSSWLSPPLDPPPRRTRISSR